MNTQTTEPQTFQAKVKDKGDTEWKVMLTGTPREARSKIVREAGMMAQAGWSVIGMNRQAITVQDPDDPTRSTEFRISRVTA